jgi:hypothetical protein
MVRFAANSSLNTAGDEAFSMTVVNDIAIPKCAKLLGKSCFASCSDLMRLTFETESRLTHIADAAFLKAGIREVRIPESVEVLGKGCFSHCDALERVQIADGSRLARIEDEAFWMSPKLRSIVLPTAVQFIGIDSFPIGCDVVRFANAETDKT